MNALHIYSKPPSNIKVNLSKKHYAFKKKTVVAQNLPYVPNTDKEASYLDAADMKDKFS